MAVAADVSPTVKGGQEPIETWISALSEAERNRYLFGWRRAKPMWVRS
ncbi:MAG: hypothetical protein WCD18_24585 [Thermosynechococcaceae cyanobacterium]